MDSLAKRACRILNEIHTRVPPCVLFCLVATWCNAWCTKRRFQQEGPCQLLNGCSGEDSLEHYATCACHWGVLEGRLCRPRNPQTLRRFLVLTASTSDEMVIQACHVYAVKRAADLQRNGLCQSSAEEIGKLIWQGHRIVAMYHAGVEKLHSAVWKS